MAAGAAAEPTDWWAFRRLARPAIPAGTEHPAEHPVDAFIGAALAEGLGIFAFVIALLLYLK